MRTIQLEKTIGTWSTVETPKKSDATLDLPTMSEIETKASLKSSETGQERLVKTIAFDPSQFGIKYYTRQKEFLSHETRIRMIYEHKVHGWSIRRISKTLNMNYSTAYNVVNSYLILGHTNRMRNFKEKDSLLKFREKTQSLKSKMHGGKTKTKVSTAEAKKTQKTGRIFCPLEIHQFEDDCCKPSIKYKARQCDDQFALFNPFNETNFEDQIDYVELIDYRFGDSSETTRYPSSIFQTIERFGDIKSASCTAKGSDKHNKSLTLPQPWSHGKIGPMPIPDTLPNSSRPGSPI